ncbi:MAG: hypothetical protein IPO90_08635 [Flavobacteriales bacterium]|nr:hypothetical protein [Flavobacteriales bacterium]MBL0044149.1 hypothetical protein [Flavobacteriales bacterium]
MRHLLLSLLFFCALSPAIRAQDPAPGAVVDAMVTVRIDGFNDAGLARIAARIGKEANMNLEYSCVRSGIVVLHIRPVQVSEKADVMALVKRILHEADIKGAIDFLDIHVEQTGGNKC